MPKQITMIFWRDNDIGQAHLDNVSGHGAPQVARRPQHAASTLPAA